MLRKIVLSLLVCLALGGIFFVTVDFAYAEQLLPGIKIDGQSFPKQNRTALKNSLKKKFETNNKTTLTLTLEDKQITTQFSQTGIAIDYDRIMSEAFSLSKSEIPGVRSVKTLASFLTRTNNIPLYTTVNEQIKEQFLDGNVHTAFGQRPQDANLNVTESGTEIIQDKAGMWVDDDMLFSRINQALQNHQTVVMVPIASKQADITANLLGAARIEAEAIVNKPITLLAQSKKVTPTKADIAKWIMVNQENDGIHAIVDAEKIKEYVKNITSLVEVKATAQITDKNGTVTSEGKDGAVLRIDDSVTAIVDAYKNNEDTSSITLAMDVKNKPTIVTDPQLGCDPDKSLGKYLEINLTLQKMCLYIGGQLITTFRVSTGKWSTPTPIGNFTIYNKIETAYSRAYDLKMPQWNGLSGEGVRAAEYGIHGLPYRGSWVEGQNHIGTPVSHGCIRLGKGDDEYVFGWADIGTPVYIHK